MQAIDKDLVRDLALTIINDGAGYQARCDAARMIAGNGALAFVSLTRQAAAKYQRQFGSAFGSAEILAAAAEVADYYANHVAETDALKVEG